MYIFIFHVLINNFYLDISYQDKGFAILLLHNSL